MPSRPDLRDIATNVKQAFADADKETLLDVLTFVVKEYVVEGPPPMFVHQAEQLSDLKNISFAQLITTLQTRFEFPELAMFVVDGENVSVRIGGVVQPLLAARQPLAPIAPPQQFVDTRPPQPSVRAIETTLAQRPPTVPTSPTPGPAAGPSAPPPTRGLSVRGRPSDGDAAPTPAAAAPTQPTGPAAAPAAPEKPESAGDDASTRFGLLELD